MKSQKLNSVLGTTKKVELSTLAQHAICNISNKQKMHLIVLSLLSISPLPLLQINCTYLGSSWGTCTAIYGVSGSKATIEKFNHRKRQIQ